MVWVPGSGSDCSFQAAWGQIALWADTIRLYLLQERRHLYGRWAWGTYWVRSRKSCWKTHFNWVTDHIGFLQRFRNQAACLLGNKKGSEELFRRQKEAGQEVILAEIWLFQARPPSFGRANRGQTNWGLPLLAQLMKNLPAMRKTWVRSLGWEDPLEKTLVFWPGDMTDWLSLHFTSVGDGEFPSYPSRVLVAGLIIKSTEDRLTRERDTF